MKTRNRWTRMLALVPMAGLAAVIGCSGDGIDNASREPVSQAVTPQSGVVTASFDELSKEGSTLQPQQGERAPVTTSGGMAPDIEISVPDTLVSPGETIELLVEGTEDVTELVLWDGLNDRQAFVRNENTGAWTASYRVPLRPRTDRIGISVTAKNDSDRWRRRWVFLRVVEEGCFVPAADGGTEGCEGC